MRGTFIKVTTAYYLSSTDFGFKVNFLQKILSGNGNPHEVGETLNSISVGKAAGPDGINNRRLKQFSKPFSNPLSDLFIFSLTHRKVPTTWEEADITTIFKKNDSSEISNYRPISLLNTIGKAMEKMSISMFLFFFKDNNFTVRFCTWRFNHQTAFGHV